MGADEMVPFATEAGAQAFATTHGGKVLRMGDIPDTAVLAPASGPIAAPDDADADYLERLKAATKGS